MAEGHFLTVLPGADNHEKLHALCKLTYKEQAVWFLNAFWEAGLSGGGVGEKAEQFWEYVQKASVIDNAKATGNALDEMEAHRFLETFQEAHTVLEMRSELRSTGALAQNERPKEVPLTHFLLFKFKTDWQKLVNAPQGDNSAQIAEAQDKLQAVQDAFDASSRADAEASAALAEAKASEERAVRNEKEAVAREEEAKAAEAPFKAAEAPFKAAQDEVESALAEVKAQEDAYNSKTESLKKASEEGGVVSRNRAKVSLEAHLAEDPLPLRKAKITLEAANKKAERARAPFLEARAPFLAATELAEQSRRESEAARATAEGAKKKAEEAVNVAQSAMKEAEDYLAELLSCPGSGHGALFWIERELTEKKKYMPVSKGGIR
eukprot:CAMPEP_0201485922 /NCGR_PEP_ID=MMETSP0151_2-20130828/9999_1 /ASSEMBLY_ACC=CAM_ASM_000257 /TAXON_ID=200890 /ORGANISM="Paramoeba atlantica, Strain 621/1 / CCAP 1560/9" /LENGTH=378 /DNA_ID=CAMNT_0047870271 /DNA_START=64 /DNA_END=1200 /DNA_ORIENTATION=-